MRWIHALRARMRLLFRDAAEARMEEEMRFHLEMEAERLVREEGLGPEEARRRAAIAFGGQDVHREALRDGRTLAWLGGLRLDLKLGVRMLAKYPGLTLVGGLALAFAFAVGTITFEAVKLALHPTLPHPEGERVVGLGWWDRQENAQRNPVPADLEGWTALRTIRDLGGFRSVEHNVFTGAGAGEPALGAEISASAFRLARTPPLLGRALVEEDDDPGAPLVVVLGHSLWRTRFDTDSAIVGKVLRLGSREATVVGVMPEGFRFPIDHEFWTPLQLRQPEPGVPQRRVTVFGRLAPGISLDEARSEIAAVSARLSEGRPEPYEQLVPQVLPYAQSIIWIPPDRSKRAGVYSINGFAALLLLLVCGNVALLVFARAATREREILVRTALGAGRRRIMAQLFAEALVLAGLAAMLGVAAAAVAVEAVLRAMRTASEDAWPFWFDAGLSGTTILYAALLALIAAAVAGVVPASKVTERGVETRLRQAAAGTGQLRMGGMWTGLIVAQIAATVVFSAVAFVVHRQAAALASVEPAFPAREYLAVRLEMNEDPTRQVDGDEVGPGPYATVVGELERRLAARPEFAAVTMAEHLPLMPHSNVEVEVESGAAGDSLSIGGHPVGSAAVAVDFFETFGAPIVAGRGFDSRDVVGEAAPVVVNRKFVDAVLGGRNAIGRRIRYVGPDGPAADAGHEIVGVVADLVPEIPGALPLDDPTRPQVYHPLNAETTGAGSLHLAVRARGDAGALASALRRVAADVSPELRLREIQTLDQATGGDARFWRMLANGVLLATAVALILSLAGTYSVMSFTVSRRTREIGVRVALGAGAPRVALEVFSRPLVHVTAGVATGSLLVGLLVLASTQTLSPRVAALLGAQALATLCVCALACVGPTVRALRVEPTEALRAEG